MVRVSLQLSIAAAVALAWTLACGGTPPPAAGDAGPGLDAAVPDSGGADSGAGPADSGGADAGPFDAGVSDAGGADSGAADGGDAGGVDAGCQSCDAGTCLPDGTCGCGSDLDCADAGAAGTCCALRCVDLQRDILNCGLCGNACAATSFCDGVDCQTVAFQHVCANPAATVILDGLSADGDAGAQLADSLTGDSGCRPPPSVRFVASPVDAGVTDSNGKPLVGGSELLVAAGGPFVQPLVHDLEQVASPVMHFGGTGIDGFMLRADGGIIISVSDSSLDAGHDYFLVELVREPSNGSLSLVAYGFLSPGTLAGAWYFGNAVLPGASVDSNTWYVVEWIDTNGDLIPNTGDTFNVLGAGH